MFGVIFQSFKGKILYLSAMSALKTARCHIDLIGHLCFASFHPLNGYFYIFCRTFGPAL